MSANLRAGAGAGASSPRQGRSAAVLLPLWFVLLLCMPGCQGPPSRDAADAGAFGIDDFPAAYSLGSFDKRFGISEQELIRAVQEAAEIWEKPAGRRLFRFEAGAAFRVNLVFDERQAKTLEAKKVKAGIDSKGRSYDALVWQHARRSERLRDSERRFDEADSAWQKRLDEHNAKVAYWNERGGAPAGEFAELNAAERGLEEARNDLERLRSDVNDDIAAVNDLVLQINELAAANNIDVTYYNGRFVESREFEQGVFTGRDITIYQFSDAADLRIALIHELGHALGFGHVDDPAAIMYYKVGKQDLVKPSLAAADLALLKKKFGED